MKRIPGLIPVMAAAITGVALIPGSAAIAATGTPKIPVRYYEYRAVDKKYEGRYTGDWRVCGHGVNATDVNGVTFTCTETVTVTTTATITGGYTDSEISTSVGFSISRSYAYSRALGLTVPLPKHTQANIDFGIYYSRYHAGMERRLCVYPGDSCLAWGKPSWVTVQRSIASAIGAFSERRA